MWAFDCVTVVDLVKSGHVYFIYMRYVTKRTYATCSLTHVLRTVDWMVSLEADGSASSTRAVVGLLCLDNAGGEADSRFISAIR